MLLFFNYFFLRRLEYFLFMLLIVSLTPPIVPSIILPCEIATTKVFLKFGALKRKGHITN